MTRGISRALKTMVIEQMQESGLEEFEHFGFFFTVQKIEGALPLGEFVNGKEIYMSPFGAEIHRGERSES